MQSLANGATIPCRGPKMTNDPGRPAIAASAVASRLSSRVPGSLQTTPRKSEDRPGWTPQRSWREQPVGTLLPVAHSIGTAIASQEAWRRSSTSSILTPSCWAAECRTSASYTRPCRACFRRSFSPTASTRSWWRPNMAIPAAFAALPGCGHRRKQASSPGRQRLPEAIELR